MSEDAETFTCEHCKATFPKAWSDDEAEAEARQNWGGDLPLEEKAVVCEDCYRKFIGWMQGA